MGGSGFESGFPDCVEGVIVSPIRGIRFPGSWARRLWRKVDPVLGSSRIKYLAFKGSQNYLKNVREGVDLTLMPDRSGPPT